MSRRLMILGAGSTGRGHLAQLAHEAGWELVLVDKDEALVRALRDAGCYTVRLCSAAGSRVAVVDRFRAYHVSEDEAILREGLGVSLLLTSLFSQNLAAIAPLVAQVIAARCSEGVKEPLNVVCCENMQDSSATLRTLVQPILPLDAAAYARALVGFPNCMVSRVVPVAGNPLEMVAEDYNEWTVDADGFVGPAPGLAGLELVHNQDARLARKFFLHNGGHAVCAYWGFHRGHTYIHEAVADPVVLGHVLGAAEELACVVSRRYGLDKESTLRYGLELGARGAVAEMRDSILRVVRDPLRKLSRGERLVAPAEMALSYGLPCDELVSAIAAALHYHHPDDPQALSMRARIESEGPETAIPTILGLPDGHPLANRVIREYGRWAG